VVFWRIVSSSRRTKRLSLSYSMLWASTEYCITPATGRCFLATILITGLSKFSWRIDIFIGLRHALSIIGNVLVSGPYRC
jgi:hypothetical protein